MQPAGTALAGVDLKRLRTGRLARLQASMRAYDVDVCLLASEPNVRYATGATAMPVYAMSTFCRCAIVPREGTPILFEHPNSVHRSARRAPDVRPMHAWEFFDDPSAEAATWAELMVESFHELGVGGAPVAVDRLGAPAWLALQEHGVSLRDAAPITQGAREVKTPEEIRLLEINADIVMEMLTAFEETLEPGVTERDLVATLAGTMLRRGGEYLATNTVCSGPNTNPWRAEATDRSIDAGDLVFVDTDAVGVEGYFYCVSRAFVCGGAAPTSAQRDLYRAAYDWLRGMEAVIRPGITCAEAAGLAPTIPERFVPQRYECMVHGIGLEEENPSVCHPQDAQSNPDRVLEPGMALVVELYCGEPGGREGVKLGDEVLVTDEGIRVLAPYPFDERLLGA
ncbi:MAG TPA: Xaa-Pro peptidase family protein [Actinomycetota bacterium]|nr:Xaa-Pro peptidase family protein [Actinomycetota bacterium]